MSESIVTKDLKKFGNRELDIAADLLKALANNGRPDFLGDEVEVWFNTHSAYVFLSDEDYNVAVLEDDKLVQFYTCANCGYEGTQVDAKDEGKDFIKYNGYCSKKCENENK